MKYMYKYLPYKLTKRIDKTGEGRSGLEIYKRRNSRSYRVIMQYKTWKRFINLYFKISITDYMTKIPDDYKNNHNYVTSFTENEKIIYQNEWNKGLPICEPLDFNILTEFKRGYAVLITPEEFFGSNHPAPSIDLHPKFKLGVTGFIYYSNISEYEKYPPRSEWHEVYELNTEGNQFNNPETWVGHYVLNIKNSNPHRISEICKTSKYQDKNKIKYFFQEKYPKLNTYPAQTGLGNYDYDYASPETIENVKYQMLYLALCAKESDGTSFFQYIKKNALLLEDKKDKNDNDDYKEPYKTFFNNLNYCLLAEEEFKNFEKKCKEKELLNFEKLWEIGAWDKDKKLPICPLCGKYIEPHEFFEGVEQAEGREVKDNTQRAIVLMHIDALRPGKLNHRPYNLGWGHNFCNTIQGDKDISETIEELKKIISNYEAHLKK